MSGESECGCHLDRVPDDRLELVEAGRLLDDQARTLFAMHIPFLIILATAVIKAISNPDFFRATFGCLAVLVIALMVFSAAVQCVALVRVMYRFPFDSYSLGTKYLARELPSREHLVQRMREQDSAVKFAAGIGFALTVTVSLVGCSLILVGSLV